MAGGAVEPDACNAARLAERLIQAAWRVRDGVDVAGNRAYGARQGRTQRILPSTAAMGRYGARERLKERQAEEEEEPHA